MTSPPITTSDTAGRLGLTSRQVHYLVETGKLAPVIRGNGPRGPLFFDPAEVDRLAAELEAVTS